MLVQASHGVFLLHSRNCEIVSHPVRLWKIDSAKDLQTDIGTNGMYWNSCSEALIGRSIFRFSFALLIHQNTDIQE